MKLQHFPLTRVAIDVIMRAEGSPATKPAPIAAKNRNTAKAEAKLEKALEYML